MSRVRIAPAIAIVGVMPVMLIPIGLRAPSRLPAPEILAGVVRMSDTTFTALDADTGSVIDPFTGQPRAVYYVGADGQRITAERIRAFLVRRDSPLAPFARNFLEAGRRYGVDPRLIVAIAGTESSFGRRQLGFNAWGWDAPHGLTRWSSWAESIEAYTRLFASAYRNRDPSVVGPRYAPFAPHWPYTTRLFFSQI